MHGIVGTVVLSGLLLGSPSALADPASEAMLQDLVDGVGLTEPEREALRPVVARHLALGGVLGHARNSLWVAMGRGCRGACLPEVLRGLDLGLEEGLPEVHAADLALDALDVALGRARRGELPLAEVGGALVADVRRRVPFALACGR